MSNVFRYFFLESFEKFPPAQTKERKHPAKPLNFTTAD